jgi:chromosomal replication initiation ATPase DnaA
MNIDYMAAPGCTFLRGQVTDYNHSIFNTVCKIFNKDPNEVLLNNKIRKREYVTIRQITMTLFVLKLKFSLNAAGAYFSDKDHTTVLHAIKTVKNILDTDQEFRKKVGYLFDGLVFPKTRKYKKAFEFKQRKY